MQCQIYKSLSKADHYVYLAHDKQPDEDLPDALQRLLGELEWVMDLELSATRKLAIADPVQVMQDVREQGFYLQMPVEDMHSAEERLFS